MRVIVVVAALVLATSCATSTPPAPASPQTEHVERLGTGCDDAVVIDAKNENDGVHAEYAWLARACPGCHRAGQDLITCNGKATDILHVVTAKGETRDFYFDISSFIGKY